jgi:phage gpG-like protein
MQVQLIKDDITSDIKKISTNLNTNKQLMQNVGEAVVSQSKRAFTKSSYRPSTWAPLAPSTLKSRKSAGIKGTKPLIATGTLSASISIIKADAKSVVVGSDRKYAAIHQLGGNIKKRKPKGANAVKRILKLLARKVKGQGSINIPARPYMPFDTNGAPTKLLDDVINDLIDHHLNIK